jgi:hypothetical protein
MARIVTTTYRYRRPPRRKKPVALGVPAVVRAADPAKEQKRASRQGREPQPTPEPSNNDPKPAPPTAAEPKPTVVTIRRKSWFGDVPELAPEEVRRRADAANEMFQDFKRQIAAKLRKDRKV